MFCYLNAQILLHNFPNSRKTDVGATNHGISHLAMFSSLGCYHMVDPIFRPIKNGICLPQVWNKCLDLNQTPILFLTTYFLTVERMQIVPECKVSSYLASSLLRIRRQEHLQTPSGNVHAMLLCQDSFISSILLTKHLPQCLIPHMLIRKHCNYLTIISQALHLVIQLQKKFREFSFFLKLRFCSGFHQQ